MADGRSNRKARVVSFLPGEKLKESRQANLEALVDLAKRMLNCLPGAVWERDNWVITSGRLLLHSGKNISKVALKFHYAPPLNPDEEMPLEGDFAELIKALVCLRFHRDAQAVTSQRQFLHAASVAAHVVRQTNRSVAEVAPEDLEKAAQLIGQHYAESTAYQMQKALGEFAAHLDANELCLVRFDWKYSSLKRPKMTNGVGFRRLDDPEIEQPVDSTKLVSESLYRLIAVLYLQVPGDHPDRIFILMLTLLACLGRRFSEIAYLPDQLVAEEKDGTFSITYFKRKASKGDTYTPSEKLPLPSETVTPVTDAIAEAHALCEAMRGVAAEMRRQTGPDLRFLEERQANARLYKADIYRLGLSTNLIDSKGWLRKNNWAWEEPSDYSRLGGNKPSWYTTVEGLKAYCQNHFESVMVAPVHIDQHGKKLYAEDMLFLRYKYIGGAGEAERAWLTSLVAPISHEMLNKFLLMRLSKLAETYAPDIAATLDFTTHHFRHTVNHMLDVGGLPDLMQTQWFGRSNPRDTKAYQHTSLEKRVDEVREALIAGDVQGPLAEQIQHLPIEKRDAFAKASVRAVHDVGTGICVHDFVQTPCERHLQCLANCHDYVYAKTDPGRVDEIKRRWAITSIQLELAEKQSASKRPRKSADWIAHQNTVLETLNRQMESNGIPLFDPHEYMGAVIGEHDYDEA